MKINKINKGIINYLEKHKVIGYDNVHGLSLSNDCAYFIKNNQKIRTYIKITRNCQPKFIWTGWFTRLERLVKLKKKAQQNFQKYRDNIYYPFLNSILKDKKKIRYFHKNDKDYFDICRSQNEKIEIFSATNLNGHLSQIFSSPYKENWDDNLENYLRDKQDNFTNYEKIRDVHKIYKSKLFRIGNIQTYIEEIIKLKLVKLDELNNYKNEEIFQIKIEDEVFVYEKNYQGQFRKISNSKITEIEIMSVLPDINMTNML